MYTTTKNPPGRLCCFPGEFYRAKANKCFTRNILRGAGGPQARRREAPPKRAEPVCPPGRRAACGSYLGFCRDYPSSCRRTSTRMTPAIRAGMADKRSLPPGEAGISSSQLMVIISPAMQAVTMPMV